MSWKLKKIMKVMNLIDVNADTMRESNLDNYDEKINSHRQAWNEVVGEELEVGEAKKARAEALRRREKISQTCDEQRGHFRGRRQRNKLS